MPEYITIELWQLYVGFKVIASIYLSCSGKGLFGNNYFLGLAGNMLLNPEAHILRGCSGYVFGPMTNWFKRKSIPVDDDPRKDAPDNRLYNCHICKDTGLVKFNDSSIPTLTCICKTK